MREAGERAPAAGDASASQTGDGPVPAGTWSETGTGEHGRLPEEGPAGEHGRLPEEGPAGEHGRLPEEGPAGAPEVLTFHDTDQSIDDRPPVAPALRAERIVRDPDLTPVPGLALALASVPEPAEEEPASARSTVQARIGSEDRPLGQVVPLHPDARGEAARRGDGPHGERQARRAAEEASRVQFEEGEDSKEVAVPRALLDQQPRRRSVEEEPAPRVREDESRRVPTGRPPAATPAQGTAPPAAPSSAQAAPEPQAPAEAGLAPEPPPARTEVAGDHEAVEVAATAGGAEAEGGRPRPPVLASESLREDLSPTEPGRRTLQWIAALAGVGGAAVVLATGGLGAFVLLAAALLLGIAALGAFPVRYEARAIGLTALGLAGLVVIVLATGVTAEPPVLAVTCLAWGAGLLFRGTYRASMVSRWMVGLSLALAIVWFVGSGAVYGLTVLDTSWQSIGSAVLRLAFVLLLLLSLLAFMDSSTTAGCQKWGAAVLAWYGAFLGFEMAKRLAPAPGQVPSSAPPGIVARLVAPGAGGGVDPEVLSLTLASAAFVLVAGFALSHVLVSASGGTISRRMGQGRAETPADPREGPAPS